MDDALQLFFRRGNSGGAGTKRPFRGCEIRATIDKLRFDAIDRARYFPFLASYSLGEVFGNSQVSISNCT
jgi:hypothetical protein